MKHKPNGLKFPSLLFFTIVYIIFLKLERKNVDGANILFLVGGVSTHSHRVGMEPLANKLADLGHNITFFSPIPSKNPHPKITEVCPEGLKSYHRDFEATYGVQGLQTRLKHRYHNEIFKSTTFFDMSYGFWSMIFKDPEFQQWISRIQHEKEKEKTGFDLMVIDNNLNEGAHALAYKLGVKKTISYNCIGVLYMWDFDFLGIPADNSWLPTYDFVVANHGKMSLLQRIQNTLHMLKLYWRYVYYHLPRLDKLAREELNIGDEMPALAQLKKNDALVLVNTHVSDNFAMNLPPFAVPIGGMHTKESQGILEEDLETFIAGAAGDGDAGFIFVSFGSAMQISSIPPELLQIFLEAFASFPIRFLWKWEGEIPNKYPNNIRFQKWFQQQDVLAHKKIRGFISQGGAISLQQAIFHGVPLIIIPGGGDQDFNGRRTQEAGNGFVLEFMDLTVDVLQGAIRQLTEEKKYKNRALKLSRLAKDRPVSPVDTAVWWTEYVLRHDDLSHLKPLSSNQPFWQYRQLDVWGILISCAILVLSMVLFIFYSAFKYMLRFRSGRHQNQSRYQSNGNKQKTS